MSEAEARAEAVVHWLRKADEALAAARREQQAGDNALAINRVYYACFYAATALFLSERQSFSKHSGVRSAVHQLLVKPGRLSSELAEFYDRRFDDRNEVDYEMVDVPEPAVVRQQIKGADRFVAEMKRLLSK